MKWQKRGLVWAPQGDLPWAQTHASLPLVHVASPNQWWVYVSCRDADGKSRVGRLVVDTSSMPVGMPTVGHLEPAPVLSLGEPGTFDDSGAMPSWLIQDGDLLRMYYIGWNVATTVPYRISIGLAISEDGGATFRRYSQGPIIDRSTMEPFFVTSHCVRKENDTWRMWYVSCTGWQQLLGRWEPSYHVKYAESRDGIAWNLTGISCIDAGDGYPVARPCVFRKGDAYAMLYSYRCLARYRTDPTSAYRLGYAESADGIRWQRMDDLVGIESSTSGWDSEMIEYCWLQRHGEETYLLYNGNGFGRSGFGLARLTSWD